MVLCIFVVSVVMPPFSDFIHSNLVSFLKVCLAKSWQSFCQFIGLCYFGSVIENDCVILVVFYLLAFSCFFLPFSVVCTLMEHSTLLDYMDWFQWG